MITTGWSIPQAIATAVTVSLLAAATSGCQVLPAQRGEVVGPEPTPAATTPMPDQPTPSAVAETATPSTGGTATPAATSTPIPETVEQALRNAYADVESFQAQVALTAGTDGSPPLILRQWFKQPNLMKLEVIKPGTSGLPVGTVLIYNGKGLTIYDPSSAQVVEIGDPRQLALFLHLPMQKYAPVMQLIQLDALISSLSARSTVTLGGVGTIAGRTARVVRLAPQPSGRPFREVRLWLDRQTLMPLHVEAKGDDGAILLTIEYLLLERATPVSDDAFSFRPPANTSLIRPTMEEMLRLAGYQSASLPDIQGRAGYSILQPAALPPGITQRDTQFAETDGAVAVAISYGNADSASTVLVQRRADGLRPTLPRGKEIAQGGFTGRIQETHTVVALDWVSGNTALSLVSMLPRDEAVRIAASVR
ncbi:MAG: LolA family protein [Sphingomonadaceae bacterium]